MSIQFDAFSKPTQLLALVLLVCLAYPSLSYASIFSARRAEGAIIVAKQLAAEAAVLQADRELFAALLTKGGTFRKIGNKPYPVCTTKNDYVHYVGYLIGRYATLPKSDVCWELDYNTDVKFTAKATDDEDCNRVSGVCEFQYSTFGFLRPTVWTSIHNFDPRS